MREKLEEMQFWLILRPAWFINSCFFNSEVWCGFKDKDLSDLEVIDHKILKLATGGQAKIPTEMLYLECAQIPIKNVLSVRRLSYLHNILRRDDSELIKQIYMAMKENPLKDDWIHLVENDKTELDINLTDQDISKLSKCQFTRIVKSKMRKYVFRQLQETKEGHIKVKHIIHSDIKKPQAYLTSHLFTHKQSSLLLNLRCQCVNEFKSNFYTSICPLCNSNPDTQEHAIVCPRLKQHIK